jgi:hypothetical protein
MHEQQFVCCVMWVGRELANDDRLVTRVPRTSGLDLFSASNSHDHNFCLIEPAGNC